MMIRMVLSALALLLAGSMTLAEEKSEADLKKMAGTWTVVEQEFAGKELDGDLVKSMDAKLIVKGSTFESHFGSTRVNSGTVKVDAKPKLRELDIIVKEGQGKGETIKAIYQFKDGKMIVCVAQPGKERPTEFKTKKGEMKILLTYAKK